MRVLTIDPDRCPGVAVCAARACQTFLGESFTEIISKSGKGLISDHHASVHAASIDQAICYCPAGAIGFE